MNSIRLLVLLCTLGAFACGSVANKSEALASSSEAGEAGAATDVPDTAPTASAGGSGTPHARVWHIGGQSNGNGKGVYAGEPILLGASVQYFVDGAPTPLVPQIGALYGIELGLAPAITENGTALVVNKGAFDGMTCAQLIAYWPHTAIGIAAVRGLGDEYDFAWIQGEADASKGVNTSQSDYAACLRDMIARVRAAFRAPVRAHILQLNASLRATLPGTDTIRAAEQDVVSTDGNADLVSMDDSPPKLAGIHYDGPQLVEIGRRFAAVHSAQ